MKKKWNIKWRLAGYDALILLAVLVLLLAVPGASPMALPQMVLLAAVCVLCVFALRLAGGVYQQIWRYGGNSCYVRMAITDCCAFLLAALLETFLLGTGVGLYQLLSILSVDLLGAMLLRMVYQHAYNCGNDHTAYGRFLKLLLRIFAGKHVKCRNSDDSQKQKAAIFGAGRVGAALADELLSNPGAAYVPVCFVDAAPEKVGRQVHGIPVVQEDEQTLARLRDLGVQDAIIAIANLPYETKQRLYKSYTDAGFRVKVYDYPLMKSEQGRRHLRDFDIEEVLFRKPVAVLEEKTIAGYRDKTVLITGGGGSIGTELCRQLARMQPRQIVILDIYENGVYDIQQELKRSDPGLKVQVEIASITNASAMERVFRAWRPQIVVHAAAHKHVPLMEHNCVEAVENNVFGTIQLVELCERYAVERFILVSTDKAVNPTNVMGATKRMCEMIVQCAGVRGKVIYSAVRFGNVLGSAGSVVPLFRRQIMAGGPVTITDKRMIRYFMTIPEAAQLVLQAGALAKNGEIFVLDMGQPVKILDLAETMIRLAEAQGIEIVETGLRPGEKLYEELLVKTDELDKTENSLIFIDRGEPVPEKELAKKIEALRLACVQARDKAVKTALKQAVPTFKNPDEVNPAPEDQP